MQYIGVKIVEAEPMTRGQYNNNRGWVTSAVENKADDGYLVIYPDGYKSWCPKKQFEEANRPIDGMTFGHALEALKKGLMVSRKGWNGKGMFVFKQVPSPIKAEIVPKMTSLPQSVKAEFESRKQGPNYVNQLALVQPDGRVDSWLASSSDIFAEDWQIVNMTAE